MDVRSVGLATDLALIATRGDVIDRGAYLVAVTPGDPDYYYGNLLVLPAPLRPGQLAWALALFAREVAARGTVHHVTLCWDLGDGDAEPPGATDELVAAGLEVEVTHVMVAGALQPAAPPPGIELRPLAPDELARAAELAFANDTAHDEAQRQFRRRRAAWQRDLVTRGAGRFWGAFDDRTLVGSLGLVRLGRLGRYQDVLIASSHRRRGIAAALLAISAQDACAAGVEQLVIQTEWGSDAKRVYERAGFRAIERLVSACREPP